MLQAPQAVVRRLAGNLTPDQTVRLRVNLDAQAKAVNDQDNESATRLDTEFHLLLCEFLDNREITQAMERLRGKLHRLILGIQRRNPERLIDGWREHEAIAESVNQGRGEQAAQRVIQHLEWGKKFLVSPK